MKNLRIAIHLLLISIIIIICYFINVSLVKKETPNKVMEGGAFYNFDINSYRYQLKNYIYYNDFNSNLQYPEYRVRRTPFYPIFIGVPLLIFGEKQGITAIIILQLLLHIIATYLFYETIKRIVKNNMLSILACWVYGLCPFLITTPFVVITEAITPFFVVLIFYLFVRYIHDINNKWLILLGFALGISCMHRPTLIFFTLPIGIAVIYVNKNSIKRVIYSSILLFISFIVVLLPWTVRNFIVTKGEFILLEKWYYEDPMKYGVSHIKLRSWVSCFANPANYSTEIFANKILAAADKEEYQKTVNKFITNIPTEKYNQVDKKRIINLVLSYAHCLKQRNELMNKNVSLKQLYERECEQTTKIKIDSLIMDYKTKYPINYYILTPSRILLRDGIFHSNSSGWHFLNLPSTSSLLKYPLKIMLFAFNILLWLSLLLSIYIRDKKELIYPVIFFSVLIFVIFHVYFFRYFESRYFLPIYPMLLFCFILLLDQIKIRYIKTNDTI